jgi:NadR type nicotinamide-nucleotide adenylyltransferase
MKKIVLIGPESTGKTTLAEQLAKHYKTSLVQEFARTYIEKLNRPYEQSDLLKIAKGQLEIEDLALAKAEKILICDTDLIVIEIWSAVKYGEVDKWISEQILTRQYDLYLLCGTDVPWTFDEQREHPNERNELYQLYLNRLRSYDKKFIELIGNQSIRLKKSIEHIDKLL